MRMPEPVWQESTVLRARDLTAPDSISGGPAAAGPSTGLPGPSADLLVIGVALVFTSTLAVLALAKLALPGFVLLAGMSAVIGWVGRKRWQQASHPVVVAGPGGLWLAGTDHEPGRAIAWGDVDELVFGSVTERRVLSADSDSESRRTARRALGVRLRVPLTLPADEQQKLQAVLGPFPEIHEAVLTSMHALLATPYRELGAPAASKRPAFEAAVRQYAPHVRVVDGPPAVYDLVWRPGGLQQ
jgi:hypothetical protein